MNKENQIDEIAKLICTYPQCVNYNKIGGCKAAECSTVDIAENLFDKGYRKETETIAEFKELVKEYLLDRGLYLTAVKNALKYAENKMRKEDEGK